MVQVADVPQTLSMQASELADSRHDAAAHLLEAAALIMIQIGVPESKAAQSLVKAFGRARREPPV